MSFTNPHSYWIFLHVSYPWYIGKHTLIQAMDEEGCRSIAETHLSAIFYLALRNPTIWIVSMLPSSLLIFGYHPGQSPRPFE